MKNEIMKDYNMFSDCWKLYKELYPPHPPEDESYWQYVVQKTEDLAARYRSQLCEDILCDIVKDLERKSKIQVA